MRSIREFNYLDDSNFDRLDDGTERQQQGVRLPNSIGDHPCDPPRWPGRMQLKWDQSTNPEGRELSVCFCFSEGTVCKVYVFASTLCRHDLK